MINNFKFIYNEKWKSYLQNVYKQNIMFPTRNIYNKKKRYMHNKIVKTMGLFLPLKSTQETKKL